MSNIVEFIIKLGDQWSNPMAKVTKSTVGASYTIDELTEAGKKLKTTMGVTAGSISDLRSKIIQLQQIKELLPTSATKQLREVNREIKKLQENIDKVDGSSEKEGFSKLFSGLPGALKFAAIGAGITKVIGEAMDSQKIKEQFKNEFGDSAGAGLYEGLNKMKGVLGEGVMDLGKQLAFAGEPLDNIENKMRRLGDVANGDQGKLQSLVGAFAQLRQDGKVTESTLSQLEAGGFKPLVLISEQTGQSLARVRERFAAGKISANQIEEALRKATDAGGLFAGNMDRLNATSQSGWDGMILKVKELSVKIGTLLLPVVDPLITKIGELADWVSGLIDQMQPLFSWIKKNSDILLTLAGTIGTMITVVKALSFAKGLWLLVTSSLIPKIIAMNAALLANPIGLVIAGIAGLVAGIVIAWNKFEGFRKVVYGVWETVKEVFTSIGNLFKQIFGPIGEAIQAIREGRWLDAAKATGKLLFNLTPAGLIKNVKEFTEGGGFDNIAGAYGRGAQKGADSWAADQDPNKASIDATKGIASDKDHAAYNKASDKGSIGAGINAIAGGGTKNITINIGKFIEEMNFHMQNSNKQMALESGRSVEEAMVRAIASASAR